MRILIITGGSSSERRISLISARQVKAALLRKNHTVKLFDIRDGYKMIKFKSQSFDVIFPVLHGEEGEGGDLQRFLSAFNKPFVGGNWRGFKKAWYKIPFKRWCDKNKILTPRWRVVKDRSQIMKFGFPSVLKASNGGSSKEVVILKSKKDSNSCRTRKILNMDTPLLIEDFINGIEVTCGILNDSALPVIEIKPPDGGWFDYKNKYSGKTEKLVNAPSLDLKTKQQIQEVALKIHTTLDLGHYSRVDFFITRDHPKGVHTKLYVLEVNTIPGLSPNSLFPEAAKAIGLDFLDLMDYLVKLALKDHDQKSSI